MYPRTVPHTDSMRLFLSSTENRRFYRSEARRDIEQGELNEAGPSLSSYLHALDALDRFAALVNIPPSEFQVRLIRGLIQVTDMLRILDELDKDDIPVPQISTYEQDKAYAAAQQRAA